MPDEALAPDVVIARWQAEPDAESLLPVLPLLTSPAPEVVDAARRAVAEFVRTVPSAALPQLDESVRRRMGPHWAEPMRIWPLTPEAVTAWELPEADAPLVLGVAAMHPVGYVREAAVRRLAVCAGGAELPFLLLRANDWVGPVRWAAEAALRSRMSADRADEWLPHTALIHRLVTGERRSGEFAAALVGWLASDAGQPVLWAGLEANVGRARRWSFGLLRDAAGDDGLAVLAERVSGNLDPVLRLEAVRLAGRLAPGPERRALLERLLADPVPRVRREALWALAPAPGDEVLGRALFDRDTGVREFARRQSGAAGSVDFASVYRRAVEVGGRGLRIALLGLGETGSGDDAALFRRHLSHPLPAVRGVALHGLVRVDRAGATAALLDALGDDSPRVSLQARDTLDRVDPVIRTRVEAYVLADGRPHVRANALWLLVRGDKWSAIVWALHAAAGEDPVLADRGRYFVQRWIGGENRIVSTPTADELHRLYASLERAEGRIPAESDRQIRFAVRRFDHLRQPVGGEAPLRTEGG